MVDYLVGGERPDPYVIVEVKGPHGYAQGKTPAVVRVVMSGAALHRGLVVGDGWMNSTPLLLLSLHLYYNSRTPSRPSGRARTSSSWCTTRRPRCWRWW